MNARRFIYATLLFLIIAQPALGLVMLALFIPNWVADAAKGGR